MPVPARIDAPPSRSSPNGINLEIEYLRAVAIVLVVLLHAGTFLEVKSVSALCGLDQLPCPGLHFDQS
jgi:peptidoglycan/LPS O-acetylase OafA/YrhL